MTLASVFLAEGPGVADFSNFNPLPLILFFGVLFGPAIAVYVLLTLRERREQGR